MRKSPVHFEVLVEDKSGSIALEILLEKSLGPNGQTHSWKVHRYQGIGRIPKGLRSHSDPAKRALLNRLPAVLNGYGHSLNDSCTVLVVVDLDKRDCTIFKQELLDVLDGCRSQPNTLFRIAIEEMEAWLLGDSDSGHTDVRPSPAS